MPDAMTAQIWLQTLMNVDNVNSLSYTRHAMAPGLSEASEDSAMAKAIAYWLSILQTGGWVPTPAAPGTATAASGGTVLAGTYLCAVAYVNSATGEGIASTTTPQITSGSVSTLTVNSPSAAANATGWYAYISQANGTILTRQQAAGSPTAIGTNLTLTAPPTSSGTNPKTVDGSAGFAYGSVALDAMNHLTSRQAYYRNPVGSTFTGDRT